MAWRPPAAAIVRSREFMRSHCRTDTQAELGKRSFPAADPDLPLKARRAPLDWDIFRDNGGKMIGGGIHAVEMVFLLLLGFVVIFAALARKLQTPYPIVLVVAGLLLSFVPGVPRISLNPEVVFLVVLPPLLYGAAWLTSWRDFKFNLVSISFLAFGLVGFTVLGVAEAARQWF